MLYDSYHKKISNVVDILRKIFKHIVLISILGVLVLALIIAFMATKGIVLDDKNAPESFELSYGDAIPLQTKALFAEVGYEYSLDGVEWTDQLPISLGKYNVRATAKTIFGNKRYGKVYGFTLKPKEAKLFVKDEQIIYGDMPNVFAELAYNDTLVCGNVFYGDRSLNKTTAVPDKESVKVTNADGNDVTSLYQFITCKTEIAFIPREITVTVSDKEMIYNDTVFSFDGYEISEGTLAEGDTLQAVFDKFLIDVGEIENTPQLSVVSTFVSDGKEITKDVSANYSIEQIIGTLKVDYRPLIIETGSSEKVYDDQELFNKDYKIIGEYDVVEGHIVNCVSNSSIVDVDEIENVLVLQIKNAENEDKTDNYSLFYERGTLKITPRPVKIYTVNGTWEYDGEEHATARPRFDGFCTGQSLKFSWPSITDVGSLDNEVTISSVLAADGRDVTSNYEFINEEIGIITVTKRPITIAYESSVSRIVYDGIERTFSKYEITSGSLATKDTLQMVFPSFSQAGTYENKPAQITVNSNRTNGVESFEMYKNYDITEILGTVVIEKCKLTIQALDNTKEYDGLAFTSAEYEIVSGTLPENHELNVVYIYSGADVGEYYAEIDLEKTNVIYLGNDVSSNFDINIRTSHRLTIMPRKITVTSKGAQKVYDGTPLTLTEYEITVGELVEGHNITLNITGTQTEVGSSNNLIERNSIIITDSNGVDVTKNYQITGKYGVLEVIRRKLSVTSNSESKIYDGTALKGKEVTVDPISENNVGLLDGHSIKCELPAYVVNVAQGKIDNVIGSFDIVDANGLSVNKYYDITQNLGTLEILPIEITVITGSAEQIYNGNPLTCLEYTSDSSDKLLFNDKLTVDVTGVITNAGEVDNTAHVLINGVEVAENSNYKIIYQLGVLKVIPLDLHITPMPSVSEKEYDATPLECIDYSFSNFEQLLAGHEIKNITFSSITDVGAVEIDVIDYQITDADGQDVSGNYNLVIDEIKTLTVTKRKIVITSDSATKQYDGRPLTAPECTSEEGRLLEGHILQLEASGSQTEEGSSKNTISQEAQIFDRLGADVTHNYDISYVEGTLTVTKDVVAKVTSNKSGDLYLKVKSYGDYNGSGFGEPRTEQNTFSLRGYTCSYMLWTSRILSDSKYSEYQLTVSDAKIYMLPYYMAISGNYDIPTYTEDYSTVSTDTDYVVPYYDYSYELNGSSGLNRVNNNLISRYASWVNRNYLSISNTTKNELLSLVSANKFSQMNVETRIKEVAAYVRSIAEYNTEYDISLDSESDIAVAFLGTYREGSAKHHAIAATMLYRALGIPARYVEGYLVKAEANVQTDVKDAHAWVEVFVERLGWVRIEVTFGDDKMDITIKPQDAIKEYDGTPLKATTVEFVDTDEDIAALFYSGYRITGSLVGSQLNVGKASSKLESVKILDDEGNDVTYKFNINLKEGSLEVTPVILDVCLYNVSKTYDGKPLSYSGDKFYSIRNEKFKQAGYTFDISVVFSNVNVHTLTAAEINKNISDYVSFSVMKENEDISGNFVINIVSYSEDVSAEEYVVAQIKPRTLEITSASQTQYYTEGAKLVNNEVNITKGTLVSNQKLIAVASSVLDQVGVMENVINPDAVFILDAEANDVTGNYRITIKHGTLTFLEQ